MTIKVGVFGAGGRMGSTVCQAVQDDPDLELVTAVDPSYRGIDLRTVTGVDNDLKISGEAGAFERTGAEVVVDFSQRSASVSNLEWLAEHGVHAVVGTTGFSDEELLSFRSAFTRSNCVLAPNFAIGAVLMMHFAEL
ncbi:MAG: 4-hydroxy-tetrahydrodipicolinate reductase, partial [Microthrixaceae bacterium]